MSGTRDFIFPELGENVSSGTLTRWLKQPGDHVVAGEPLVEIATDKVDSEVEAPFDGTLQQILIAEDETADIGTVLARFITEANAAASAPAPALSARRETEPIEPAPTAVPAARIEQTSSAEPAPILSSPVQAPLEAKPTKQPLSSVGEGTTVEALRGIRKVIADRMMQSLHTSAQLTTVFEVDITALVERRREAERTGRAPSYLALIARATLDALEEHPRFNTTESEQGLVFHETVDLGIAVDAPQGLMVPVITDSGPLTADQLTQRIADIAERTREGSIRSAELSGGTFTITNTGSRGALFDTPILNSPQTAILGIGKIVRRVVPIGQDELVIAARTFVHLALTYDHRFVDGADASRFLSAIEQAVR